MHKNKDRVYTQNILLTETKELPKVRTFLDTISKNNSPKSAQIYLFGLAYFQTFLKQNKNKDLETILVPIEKNRIDRYELIQEFINYLNNGNLKPRSIRSYLTGVRVYLGRHKIYFLPQEYKYRVVEPKIYRNNKEPLEVADIRKILLACSNKRLKAFLFVIGTGGTRASETISIRVKDIDFTTTPTKITLRAEFTKTGKERYFFITDEATLHLKNWIEYKYRKRDKEENNITKHDTDYVFAVYDTRNPFHQGVYKTLSDEFNLLLKSIGMDKRREGMTRREITFHDFRTFVYSQVSDVDYNFAEWLLGHEHSTYWQKKEDVKKQKYSECMKYLRYIDPLENLGRDVESKLKEKDIVLEQLRQKQNELLDEQEKMRRVIIEMQKDKLEQEDENLLEFRVASKVRKKLKQKPEVIKELGEANRQARRETEGYYDQPIYDTLLLPDDPKFEEKKKKFEEMERVMRAKTEREQEVEYAKFLQDFKKGKYPSNMTVKEAWTFEYVKQCSECKTTSYKGQRHATGCSKDTSDEEDVQEHEYYYPEAIEEHKRKKKKRQ